VAGGLPRSGAAAAQPGKDSFHDKNLIGSIAKHRRGFCGGGSPKIPKFFSDWVIFAY
jgi:hypothetical protein